MQFVEFFDPYNSKHINAYRHLEKTGSWPDGFIPEDVEMIMPYHFSIQALAILGQAWLKHTLLMKSEEVEKLR